MKYLILLLSFFIFVACDDQSRFASIGGGELVENTLSSTGEPEDEQNPRTQALKSMVSSEVDKAKIGRKKSQNDKVVDSVGTKNLKSKESKKSHITNIKVTNILGSPGQSSTGTGEPQLDLLFYMKDRLSNCVKDFRRYHLKNSFFYNLSQYDWNVSFSYHSEPEEMAFLPLEKTNGRAYYQNASISNIFKSLPAHYVIKKTEHDIDTASNLFETTLERTYQNSEDEPRVEQTPNSNGYVSNPLGGLDHILSEAHGIVREDSTLVLVLLGGFSAYYSPAVWKSFFAKHKDIHVIVVADRASPGLSQLPFNSGYNIEYLSPIKSSKYTCGNQDIIKLITSKMQ